MLELYPVSRQWMRLLAERLDAVAILYNVTAMVDERYYRTSDPELAVIASRGTLAKWRCMGIGPPFMGFGGRILYLGKDLNDWVDRHSVKTFEY